MDNCLFDCVDEIPKRYDEGNCKPIFRKSGYNRFLSFKCGIAFDDILDPNEWETKIENGDIIVSPAFGDFVLGETTPSTIQGGCGELYVEFSTTAWTFTTPSTSEDYSDEDWWYLFNKSANGYTLGYVNCEGRLYLDDESIKSIKSVETGAVPISSPGFQMSLTNMPKFGEGPNGKGKAGIWTVSGEFIHDESFRSVEIPGFVNAINGAVAEAA